jgi:protein-S-isoprenylcysteine O-methyltransferase Ste14
VTLNARAWLAFAILLAVMALLLFVPAGTVRYRQAWVYLAIFGATGALMTIYLARRDPALLERRMRGGPGAEREPAQKRIMRLITLAFVALLIVPALDYRYGWSDVPLPLVLAGDALVAVGFFLIFLVYRENTFAAATVDVVADQKVISTGPYAVVRHPMYASALFYLLGTPMALGSYWGFLPIAALIPLLIWRILDEERLLRERLRGYREYQQTVRYRLVPGIW